MNHEEDIRLDGIIDMLGKMASLDFSTELPISDNFDSIDAISSGLNMLSEELHDNVVEKSELEIKNLELQQFAYVCSHDLKAPLRGIANLSNWIQEDLEGNDNEDVKNNLKIMIKKVHRMESLINGILAYSKAGSGSEEHERVNLNKLIKTIFEDLKEERVLLSIERELPTLKLPILKTHQVFQNLISNAIKYGGKTIKTVKVNYKENFMYHIISVSDNGKGIPPEFYDKIFMIFQSIEEKQTASNTGVGLSIVKKIVEQLNGKITIESIENKGSTFNIFIPKV